MFFFSFFKTCRLSPFVFCSPPVLLVEHKKTLLVLLMEIEGRSFCCLFMMLLTSIINKRKEKIKEFSNLLDIWNSVSILR